MELNLDGTKIIVFRNGGHLRLAEKCVFYDTFIEIVSFYKYLGVYTVSNRYVGKEVVTRE